MRRTGALALVVALLSGADAKAESRQVPLEEVLRALFSQSPAFRAPEARTRQAQGAHLAAGAPFDLVASATLQAQHALFALGPLGAFVAQAHDDVDVLASLATRTHENVTLQLSGSAPITSSIPYATDPDQPQVTLNVGVPLLKFGSDAPLPAEERAFELHARAAGALQAEDESELTSRVAEGYWLWVDGREQLALGRRIETLTRQELADVDQLIQQHARAAADREPLAAAALNAAASRLQSEQQLYERQQALWEVLGLPSPPGMLAPADAFPAADMRADDIIVARLSHDAPRERPLFAYLGYELAAAAEHESGARVGKRADLALIGQATAARVENPTTPTATELGYYGLVGLQFALPLENRAARGLYEQAAQARVEADLLAAQRRSGVYLQIDSLSASLVSLSASLRERADASEHYRLAFEDESARFHLGGATAIDVVLAEQQYLAASLAVVSERTRYAITLTRFLQQTGALAPAVRVRDAAALARRFLTRR